MKNLKPSLRVPIVRPRSERDTRLSRGRRHGFKPISLGARLRRGWHREGNPASPRSITTGRGVFDTLPFISPSMNLLREYLHFLRTCPMWWLLPFFVILGALVLIAWIGEAQPSFIYPMF